MSSKVAVLKPAGTEPVKEVVDCLERLLAEAKAGTLRSFSYAVVRTGSAIGTGWMLDPKAPDSLTLGASIGHLNHRYYAMLTETSKPAE